MTARVELDKLAFFRDLGYVPHRGQAPVHASAAHRRVLACGVRWGKTICAAMEAVAAAVAPRGRSSVGWVAAPNYDLANRVFREVVGVFLEKLPGFVVTLREAEHMLRVVALDGHRCEIRAKSADNPVSLLGEGLDWLVVDEAARLRPDIWERHLSQRLVDKRGWAILISTPRGKGWFYDMWRRGKGGRDADYESWNSPSWDSPVIPSDAIDAERGRLPESVFRQEYGAEFLEGAGQVFRRVRELATGARREPEPGMRYSAGLDLARVADYTVLVVLDKNRRVVHWDRFTRVDWAQQVERIATALKRYNDAWCLVDSTGAGEPVLESLLVAGIRCAGYSFTQQSKAKLVNNLALMLEQRMVELPTPEAWPECVDELESFEYSVTDGGTVRTGAPAGQHDDVVCALMLAAWEERPKERWEVLEL